MLPTRGGAAAAAGRGAEEAEAGRQSAGHGGAPGGEERRQGAGVQEWPDGSRYEGEFVDGLKHGKGRYTWRNGEYYEGSFYKDYRHGDGLYCWPTGHKFTGKFYLNRKEGYGHQLFPDGATFQGLYHADQRFGPGVTSYPDGCEDVGLWLGGRLLKLCASVEDGFSLRDFPEYAAYMDPAASTTTQSSTTHDSKVDTDRDLLLDETFILPLGIEKYSTNGDHLPLPPGRRRELDQHFYGELWEPDAHPQQGYKRDQLSTLPLQARMQAHIRKHRLQAENVGWDAAAVLALNRDSFGPKGPSEVRSELWIQHASRGELHAVSQIFQTGLIHPDVADSQGHTALIAATVNCHDDVIHLLLDMGADIDKLNREGMSALAVCHVLYYPFQSLHTVFTEPAAKTDTFRYPSTCGNSAQISQVDFTTDTPRFNDRSPTVNTTRSSHSHQSHLSDDSKVSNDTQLISESRTDLNEPETPSNSQHLQEDEEEGEEGEGAAGAEGARENRDEGSWSEDEKVEERQTESRCDQMCGNGGSGVKEKGRELKQREEDVEPGKRRETESRNENVEVREETEEDLEERVGDSHEEDMSEREKRGGEGAPGVERSIRVFDGHITLGSVQWEDCRAKAAGRVQQGKDKEQNPKPTFDSACSVSSYSIQVTEEVMQRSAEALSRTGIPQRSDTQETVRKMAAMKIEHRVRLKTLKLLLERGANPNVSRVPMPVLFLAIMAADAEAVRRLLLSGAHTDIPLPPERKGLYPLHVAAALPGPAGPTITELLLHAITDPDAQACDHEEIYEPDKEEEPLSTDESSHLKEGGRTALHMACQRDSDYWNASKVVALLLSHRACTDLLWSGHSPLSLAIASGNDLAVKELLNGGANPNIPLGRRVGSALCALANINYHLGGNRAKLLDMLAKAGADILMPVMVGGVVGTAVDYAHYSFNQDMRIARTPFHTLNMRERETFKARRQLLSMMGDLLRQTAVQRERETLDTASGAVSTNVPLPSSKGLPPIKENNRKPVFKFCYHCGRSVSVKLTVCSRCRKVFYCSRTCKLKAWDQRHKTECFRVSGAHQCTDTPGAQKLTAPTHGNQKTVVLKTQRDLRLLAMKIKVVESEVKQKENYSCN